MYTKNTLVCVRVCVFCWVSMCLFTFVGIFVFMHAYITCMHAYVFLSHIFVCLVAHVCVCVCVCVCVVYARDGEYSSGTTLFLFFTDVDDILYKMTHYYFLVSNNRSHHYRPFLALS
jgi:hypothetical protein